MATDSLKKRYLYRLLSNLVGAAISLVTEAIIPRGLGPRAYGNFSYLSNFFSQIIGFLEMGTSTAFYTKLSKRQTDFGLVSFYISFTGLVSFLVLIFVVFVHLTNIYVVLLPDQHIFYIYLAAVWGILTWLIQILNSMADAHGLTVSTEITKILQKGLALTLIIALYLTGQLNLTHFFYYQYCILILLACAFIWVMEYKRHSLLRNWLLSWNKIKTYLKELYDYSHPLFVLALVGLIVGVIDRWMLQRFGGSLEQGFFGLSQRVGMACFLFTGAMTQLIMREFAIAFDKNDIHEMARLFRRYIPVFYAISAYFGCFIAVQASKVTYIMGGKNFHPATYAVMIMAIYPIHQVYGQLSSTVFFATGQTRVYRNIYLIFSVIGLPLSYFLIAPVDKMGLNAGASGMAIKMVALQFSTVNLLLYYNARLQGLRFWRYFGHQVVCMGALLTLSLLTSMVMDHVLRIFDSVLISFVSSGIVYSILVAGLLMVFPIVFGLNRNDLQSLKQMVLQKVFSS